MEKNRLVELARKFLKGEANQEEQQQLHSWFDTWTDGEEYVVTDQPLREEELRAKILHRLFEQLPVEAEPSPVSPVPKVISRKKNLWVAAALLAGVLAAGTLYFINSSSLNAGFTKRVTPPVHKDLAPGGDRAILTLGDGTQIVLDSASDGQLAQQQDALVIKKNDGQIIYNLAPEKSAASETIYNSIRTPRGGQYRVTLPDGTQVWLNAETSLKYPAVFKEGERRVELNGEAYFEVATIVRDHNKSPFIVHTGTVDVTVLGTHFNINAYSDEPNIHTTLMEGSVRVSNAASMDHFLSLTPGQQAIWSVGNKDFSLEQNADVEQVLAWKNGYFKFNSTDLKTIMRQVSRWYDVEVVYEGDAQAETFSGDMPRKEYASQVFKLLELTKTVKFSIDNKKVIVKSIKK